ncbi:MAG: PTS system mannose/fructose/N-acetylgalactosamine-transporter subunit IIB [Brevinema sp.]
MSINFIRIDDRMIHGQVITRWIKEKECNGIVIVDPVAEDPVLSGILKSAVPSNLKAFIFNQNVFVEKYDKIAESAQKYFLIVKSPITLSNLSNLIPTMFNNKIVLNVGPLSMREGGVSVGDNACLIPEEIVAFNILDKKGVKIEFQLVPDSPKQSWLEIKEKFHF